MIPGPVESLKTLKHLMILMTVALCWACGGDGSAGTAEEPAGPGRLVIIGGGLQAENTPVYRAILEGRSGEGALCVFPTASASPQESMESAVGRIDAVGGPGTAEGIFISRDNPEDASLPEIAEQIQACAGFYFSGGVQTRIVDAFRPPTGDSPAFQAVMDRFRDGAVVSGSSAGAAIMNDPMIGGGSSEGALAEGVRGPDEEGEGVILEKGMGFLGNTLVDQHFLARGRWARLLVAVTETDAFTFGAGIDENTALVVEGDSARVVGASGVVFFDTGSAMIRENEREAGGIVVYLLGDGDRVDLGNGTVRFDPGKSEIFQGEEDVDLSSMDLFERWNLLRFFAASAASPRSVFTFSQNGYEFEFRKGVGFRGVAAGEGGVQGLPGGLAAGPYLLSFSRLGEG